MGFGQFNWKLGVRRKRLREVEQSNVMKSSDYGQRRLRHGFTLMEILIVVVILGTLAAIVIAQFNGVTVDAERTAFIATGRQFVMAAQRYELDYGIYPNAAPGTLPPGFGDYIRSQRWEGETPLGGLWDSHVDAYGVQASLGVFYGAGSTDPHYDDAYMEEVDLMVDDGDLQTGSFRKMGGQRYYFVIAY